jgi:hypothetical protein
MAYQPTLKDIPQNIPATQGGYQPSISDLPQNVSQQIPFNPGFFEKLAPNILAGSAQLGHSVINAPSNIARFAASKGVINPETAEMVPRQQDYNYSEMLKLPGTPADQIVQSLSKNLPAMVMPALRGASFIPTALSRIGGQAGFGALTNENPAKGAAEFGGVQAAIEGLSLPFRAVGQIAEFANPLKYAKNTIAKMKSGYDDAVKAQKAAYAPVNAKYGQNWMTANPENYLGFDKNQIKYFTPEIKRLYTDFIEEPTFRNMHELQSQIGKDWARMASNPNKINTAQTLKMARESLNKKIVNYLSHDKQALASYEKGGEITKSLVSPYLSNPILRRIAYGKIKEMEPQKLANAISKATQKEIGAIPSTHELNNLFGKLQNRINVGQSIQNALPIGLGALGAMGGSLVHPALGTLAGAGGGAAAGKYLTPSALNLAQNPAIINLLQNYINPVVQGAGRQAVGYNMSNQ